MKSNRFGAMQRGEVDMIVDEAVRGWINAAATRECARCLSMKRCSANWKPSAYAAR